MWRLHKVTKVIVVCVKSLSPLVTILTIILYDIMVVEVSLLCSLDNF